MKKICSKCGKEFFPIKNEDKCFICFTTIKYCKKLFWLSRHPLTNGQKAVINRFFGDVEVEQQNVIFNDQIVDQLNNLINPQKRGEMIVALVAPLKYGLTLLRAGYTIIEFENAPSARQKGVFICKGMNIHTLHESRFIPCPLSSEEQEEGNLNYNTAR